MCYALTSPIGGAIYKKQMRLLWSDALKQQEELIKLPVCLCQLQEVNFIRGTGQNHICTCILRAVPEPEAEQRQRGQTSLLVWQSDALVGNDMEMVGFISTHSYEILAIF